MADPIVPPGPSTVDLHTHSRRSDGILEPGDLLAAAAACGVTTFALTDHDTLAGYREVLADDAIPVGMTLLPGVEINALVTRDLGLWEGELHILGIGVDPGDETFEATLSVQRQQRRVRFARTVERLRELDLGIDGEVATLAPDGDDALGRPTIARALVAAGLAASVEDAFARVIGHGTPGYVRRDGLGPDEAIRAIVAAGGLAILAHFREAPTRLSLLRELDLGIDGEVATVPLDGDDALGRPTIARALVAAGHAASVEDAFARLIGHGTPGYVRRDGLGPDEAIRAIVAAGGLAILAHFREAPTRLSLLRELIEIGLCGLEVHYRSFDAATTTAVGEVARSLGLLPTGGTDYHGDLGPYAASHAALWVPLEVGDALLERLGHR